MESAMSFSQLVAEFKSQLEKQNIPLKGQLIFSVGESPEVNVVFQPSPSSSSIEQGRKQNSLVIADTTSAHCHVSSSFGIGGPDFALQNCPGQNNDIQNRSLALPSKDAVEHDILTDFEGEKRNSENEKAHRLDIGLTTYSDDANAIAHKRTVDMTQSTFESYEKGSVKYDTIEDEDTQVKHSDRGPNLRIKDLNKFSHSELVSILADILKSKTENNAKILTNKNPLGKSRKNSKNSSYLSNGSKCLEIRKKDQILEDNSNFVADERDKSIRRKEDIEAGLHRYDTPTVKCSDKAERIYLELNKKRKLILKSPEDYREKRNSFKKEDEQCLSLTQKKQEVSKKEIFDMTGQKGLVKKKHSSQIKKSKSKLQMPVLKYSCSGCSTTFTNKVFYKRHMCKHSSGFQCDVCGKTLKSKDSLYHHQRGLHALKKHYSCQQCNITFNFYHSYKLHVQKHQGQRPFQCQICHKTYLTSNHLKVHVEATHKVRKKVCHVCGKTFSYSCSLKTHLQKHLGEKPFKCDMCDKRFTSNQSLKAHQLSHDPSKNYFCDVCGNSYKSEHSKNVHMKHHSKQKLQFICELCGKTFHFKSTLTAHLNVHSKAKPYLCSLCGKGFKSKAALYTHKASHKGEQSYACTACGKTLKTKGCYAAHMKRHSNQLNFTCNMCGSTFPDKGGLTKHIRTIHEPSKQYVCTICGKRGTRGDNMRTHVKNHNKELNESTNPMDFIIEENVSEAQLGFNSVRSRVRGPKRRGSTNLHMKDILHNNEIKDDQQHADNLSSLDLSNQFKSQLGSLPTLQANLLALPLMDSSQFNSHLSYMTGDSFLQGDTQNSDVAALVVADQQDSQEDCGLFQHEVNKTFYLALMQTQSNDFTASNSLNYNPMDNLLSVISSNSEQDSSVINTSILPEACHEAMDLPQHTSSGQMHQLAVSCMYPDAEEANITPLHELLNR